MLFLKSKAHYVCHSCIYLAHSGFSKMFMNELKYKSYELANKEAYPITPRRWEWIKGMITKQCLGIWYGYSI